MIIGILYSLVKKEDNVIANFTNRNRKNENLHIFYILV